MVNIGKITRAYGNSGEWIYKNENALLTGVSLGKKINIMLSMNDVTNKNSMSTLCLPSIRLYPNY